MRFVLMVIVILVGACKANFQNMSGGTGAKKGGGAGNPVTDKDESLAYGNETTQDTSKPKGTKTSTETDGTDDQAVPPESIAGAFLTCDFAHEAPPSPTDVIYACAVTNAFGRVAMQGIKQSWRLATSAGVTIETRDYPIDDTADKAWVLAKVSGVRFVAELTLVDALGETHILKTECGCAVTTPI